MQLNRKKAVLLLNLGSPDSCDPSDVKVYLREFLMDPYVLDIPFLFRWLLVNLIILNTRPKKSADAYSKVWTDDGSPLIVTSKKVQAMLQEEVSIPVGLGMRYGNPSTQNAVRSLWEGSASELEDLFIIPLYPHYADSSFGTAIKEAQKWVNKTCPHVKVTVKEPFYDDSDFISALVSTMSPYMTNYDHIVFSYHGLPERHLRKADPSKSHCLATENCCDNPPKETLATCYKAQCHRTTKAIAAAFKLEKHMYTDAFQSRLLNDPWVKPYTDHVLERLAKDGVKRVLVLCPAFVSDCLETIEEIGMEAKEEFEEMGGENLTLIPCLNTSSKWVAVLCKWVKRFSER
jgi:ferrochelatase